MKILVIDDQPYNIASARLTLKDFDLTTVDSIAKACEILATGERFDVVLTDLYLPRGSFSRDMSLNLVTYVPSDTMVPAGLVFAIRAANDGMKVVICTDSDHHRDPLCTMLDLVNEGKRRSEEKMISFVEARACHLQGRWENGELVESREYGKVDGGIIKDWFRALFWAKLVQYKD
jgi:CheY-like chemotaxis protein